MSISNYRETVFDLQPQSPRKVLMPYIERGIILFPNATDEYFRKRFSADIDNSVIDQAVGFLETCNKQFPRADLKIWSARILDILSRELITRGTTTAVTSIGVYCRGIEDALIDAAKQNGYFGFNNGNYMIRGRDGISHKALFTQNEGDSPLQVILFDSSSDLSIPGIINAVS